MTTTRVRYAQFEALTLRADEAGRRAAGEAVPEPMVVVQRANALDDRSAVEQAWFESEGACGFGWVTVRPGTSSFARWARNNGWRTAYGGGTQLWSPLRTQSYERNLAYCRAYAEVLREAGINAYAGGRLD